MVRRDPREWPWVSQAAGEGGKGGSWMHMKVEGKV